MTSENEVVIISSNYSTISSVAKNVPYGWKYVFEDAEAEIDSVSDIITEKEKVGIRFFPLKKDIFNAFHYTHPNNIKVVIVGQDPYPQEVTLNINNKTVTVPRSIGMSFSVRKEDEIPPSLKNIFKELENTVPNFKMPKHGNLQEWASQGVLLLNKILTIEDGSKRNEYGEAWFGFLKKVINYITKLHPKCIWVLWGNPAKSLEMYIPDTCIVLTGTHPSPQSANGNGKNIAPFFGCNHFNLINEHLIKQGKTPIDWNIYE